MAPVMNVSREQLLEQREHILQRLGVTLEEYIRRSDASELSGDEWDARDDLDSIAFLLGEDDRIHG